MSSTLMRLVDYHVHSVHSVDGQSSVDEMCSRAIEVGLSQIGFCEHVEFEPGDSGLNFLNYEKYGEAIDEARSKYGTRLKIRKGIELDYTHAYERKIEKWLSGKDFDFLVGSVHYIDHVAFDLHRNSRMPPELMVQRYYAKIRQAVESGFFDVIGHLDYIRNYVPTDCDTISIASDTIDAALEMMTTRKMHLEINSRRRADRDTFPSRRLIQRYLDKGGRFFSFGSDAHSAERVGTGIRQAIDALQNLRPQAVHVLFE